MRHITKVQAVFRARKVRQKDSMMKAPPPTTDEDSHLYTPRPIFPLSYIPLGSCHVSGSRDTISFRCRYTLFGAHDVNKNLLLDREEVRGMLNKLFCLQGTAGIAEEELDHMMVRPSRPRPRPRCLFVLLDERHRYCEYC